MGETPNLTGEFVGETHGVLEHTQTHPPRNQHQKGPICLWVAEEVTESWQRDKQLALFPLQPLPHIQCHNAGKWVACPGKYLRICPLQCNRCVKTKRYDSNERTDQNSRERNKQWEIANLSDAQFKTLIIRMVTEMVECGHKIEEEVKVVQSEIKKNIQGTNSEGKETRT